MTSDLKGVKSTYALTNRLVSIESVAAGLEELLSKLLRYTVIIKRPGFSWETGRFQSAEIVLFEDEKLINNNVLDPRILKAKRVVFILTSKDRGVASLDLKSRQIQYWAHTPELSNLIAEFNDQLLRGARSRWFTPGAITALIVVPFFAFFMPPIIDIFSNPKIRHIVFHAKSSSNDIQYDQWALTASVVIFVALLLLILMAVILGLVRIWASPLLIWPEGLTPRSFLQVIHKICISVTLRGNINNIIVGVVTASVVLIITKLL